MAFYLPFSIVCDNCKNTIFRQSKFTVTAKPSSTITAKPSSTITAKPSSTILCVKCRYCRQDFSFRKSKEGEKIVYSLVSGAKRLQEHEKELLLQQRAALQMSVEDAANYKASRKEMSQMQPRVDVGQQGRVVRDTSQIHLQSKLRVDVGQQGRIVRDTSQIHSQSKPKVDVGQQGCVVRDTSQIHRQSKSRVDVGQQGRVVRDTSQIHSQSKPTFDFGQQAHAPAHTDLSAKAEKEYKEVGVAHLLGKSEALEGLAERYGLIED